MRKNSIRVTFSLEGKQHRKTIVLNGAPMPPTPANIRVAERMAADIREKVRLGMFNMAEYFPDDGSTTGQAAMLSSQLIKWMDTLRIEESTRAGYQSAVKFWSTALPVQPLKTLKLSTILRVIASRTELSGKTVNNYVSVLREALQLAVQDGVLKDNPADEVPRAKWQKDPPDPFSREESGQIIAHIKKNHPAQVANLVEFWFWTGMRTSEVFALSWANVDLASGTALVCEANVRGVLKKNTKTNVARMVKLNSIALSAVQHQRQHTQMSGGTVFTDERYGMPWSEERAFRRSYWEPTLKRLGIRYRRPYNMRHSYATAMLMAGMTPAYCAKQLGQSVEVFLRTYAKWIDGEQNDREMNRLENTLSQIYPPETEKAL